MKKRTSTSRIMLMGLALIPIMTALVFLFSNQTTAQSSGSGGRTTISSNNRVEDANVSPDVYFKGATIWLMTNGKYEAKKYDEMTTAEKAALPPVPRVSFVTMQLYSGIWLDKDGKYGVKKDNDMTAAERMAPPPRFYNQVPTEDILNQWKNNPPVHSWLGMDNKSIKNAELANYKPDDFSHYEISKYKMLPMTYTNRTSKVEVHTNLRLFTNSYYEENIIKPRKAPGKVLTVIAYPYSHFGMYVGPPQYTKGGVKVAK